MKTKLPWILVVVLGGVLAFTWMRAPHAASGHPLPPVEGKAKKILYYVDPMHPWYKSDKPGKAPDCGMDLVAVYDGDANAGLTISPQRQQLIGVQTGVVERRAIGKTIRTNARVAADETRLAKVTTKFDGYIQQLYVNFTGEAVRKGQPLFTIYSPDLLSAQQEYLLALRSSVHVPGLLEAARDRLRLWDISDADIRALEKSGNPKTSLTIHSPVSGVVTNKTAVAGARAMAGEPLYEIANLDRVWALADVYESELPFVKNGAAATVTVNGSTFNGRVTFIAPVVDPATRTVKVRIEIDNHAGALKPDMFAEATIDEPQRTTLVVPASAVIQTGTRNVVFVVNGNAFEPRNVDVGARDDQSIEIRSGVVEGEKVATQANFLIDSESRLRKELAK
ncbi:MAG TPA: efflux RND transporter periplasmic adaptor subunit [Thermoanaerobaculia bacterium]|jgi:Cu(I)/Ag(I) efflux system membrane fusion protein|nr:efflux RND transporter periplasmic adaptor subunit [Thermoanaerobaculia bacterium]